MAVELPVTDHPQGVSRYPFDAMDIGESIWAPNPVSARYSAGKFKRKHPGWGYGSKAETRSGVKGCRIWRVS